MAVRTALVLLLIGLLACAFSPAALEAQGWLAQTHEVSARLEADAETLAFPARRNQVLVLPEGVDNAQVCVDTIASAAGDWRTRVRVLVSRVEDDGSQSTIEDLVFEWRESDPPLNASRCQAVAPLLPGDAVEFRFRFFETPPLRLLRRDRRIATLPVLTVTGWVQTDPQAG